MKKTEAISILATSVRPREPKDRARYDEAVKMAIEALKRSETPKSSERTAESAQNASSGAHENDLISREAAIEALARMMPRSYTPDGSHPADEEIFRAQEVFADCIEALEILPSVQSEPYWIPCSKRMPEYNESVLTWDGYVFCIEKRIPYIRDDDGEPIEGDWWVDDEYDEYESECYPNLRDGAAIAWMPLPEPYRGGEKE